MSETTIDGRHKAANRFISQEVKLIGVGFAGGMAITATLFGIQEYSESHERVTRVTELDTIDPCIDGPLEWELDGRPHAIIDGRCNANQKDAWVFSEPSATNVLSIVAILESGVLVEPICYEKGETVIGVTGMRSKRWVKIEIPPQDGVYYEDETKIGFVSELDLHGLDSFSLENCTSPTELV